MDRNPVFMGSPCDCAGPDGLRMASIVLQVPTVERRSRLPEEISPAARRADVRVAEPELVVEELAIGALALEPQLRRHDRGIAQDADDARIIDYHLVLEGEGLVPRALLDLRARD